MKTVKNVTLRTAQTGRRKIATTNFTHRTGTISGDGAGRERVAGTTCGATFTRRADG
ncbi:MAG: hypothetical protein H0W20_06860 [Chthoniobacterales bacterium]|nr:hypothetical protein [Chthoniobacterales bacterium]